MAKRNAAPPPTEFFFDAENLIPPSQVPRKHQDEYWTALMSIPGVDHVRAAIATEQFFPLLKMIPKAFWEKRFFVYLYRTAPKVKNSEREKYIDKYPFAIDEAMVKEEHGGGGYLAYLNMDGKEQLKQNAFDIDGPPKLKAGQVLTDGQGNPLPQAPSTPAPGQSESAQIMSAASDIMKKATEGAIELNTELTRKQLGLDPPQKNEFQEKLLEILLTKALEKPAVIAPAADPVQTRLMEKIIDRAFATPEAPEREEKATPLDETMQVIEKMTGGVSLPELMDRHRKNASGEPASPWAPLISAAASMIGNLIDKYPLIQAQQLERLRLEIQLRSTGATEQPAQPRLMPAPGPEIVRRGPPPPPTGIIQPLPTNPPTNPQPAIAQTGTLPDPGQLMQTVVQMVIAGFKRVPVGEWGQATASAIDLHFGEALEAMGITETLGNADELKKFIDGIPELKALRDSDARWKLFETDFVEYTTDRWGPMADEEEAKPGPQPPAA